MTCVWVFLVMVLVAGVWFVRHQRSLRRRAGLMIEAIRNRDFTFRLPTKGLPPGERAMQQALNQLGEVVRQQVNQNEVEAWERLTRVLTHEIMNSLAPITSISQSMLCRDDVKGTPLEEGIRAIHATSNQLNAFVDSYRKLSQLQKPMPEEVGICEVVADIMQLYPVMEWQVNIPGNLTVHADPGMLRQVLVNLVKNAIEAKATKVGIDASYVPASIERGGEAVALLVSNDGTPIPAEVRSSVFVPFFTTKRGGSGIGLSLSRRMMMLQGGGLELADRPQPSFHTTFQCLVPRP